MSKLRRTRHTINKYKFWSVWKLELTKASVKSKLKPVKHAKASSLWLKVKTLPNATGIRYSTHRRSVHTELLLTDTRTQARRAMRTHARAARTHARSSRRLVKMRCSGDSTFVSRIGHGLRSFLLSLTHIIAPIFPLVWYERCKFNAIPLVEVVFSFTCRCRYKFPFQSWIGTIIKTYQALRMPGWSRLSPQGYKVEFRVRFVLGPSRSPNDR